MPDAKSRARVERLLRDDFHKDDLTGLFLFARDHCDGREAVADVGHFVAHHHERDRGIITRAVREWFAVVRYQLSIFSPGGPHPFYADRMPVATRAFFLIAAKRIGASTIRKETGLRLKEADHLLQNIAGRLTQNDDMTWRLPANCSKAEIGLIECVSSKIVAKPAFSAEDLSGGFIETLKSNGLITKEELRSRQGYFSTLVYLFAIAAMHNCVVKMDDGSTIRLTGWADRENGQIHIGANIPTSFSDKTLISSSMFTAPLDPTVHCHPDLLSEAWDFEIELSRDRKLAPLK